MIKRILVALDPDEDTPVATDYAIQIASGLGASVTGLAVVDTSNIYTDVGGGEMNVMHYAKPVWDELSEQTRTVAERLLNEFQQRAEEGGVRSVTARKEGASFQRIIESMQTHDLLILGRDSHFFYNEPGKETKTLAKVVCHGSSPVLVVPDQFREIRNVLVAFDGSHPAARSLKSFVQLMPFGNELKLELYLAEPESAGSRSTQSGSMLDEASDYLGEHGFENVNRYIDKGADPGPGIIRRVEESSADLVVLGAHSVSLIRRVAFGSVTHELLSDVPVPLFLSP